MVAAPSAALDDDAALVRGLRAGDPGAFDAAYDRYRARLYAFLLRLSGRADLAQDLLQETWIRLATRATTLAPDTRLAPWLFTVARNLFVSHRRWVLLDEERLRTLHLGPRREPETPHELLAATEAQRRAEAALAALPLAYREVLLLVAVERLEPAEAAQVLELKPDALRQRLARARAMIKEAMRP